MQDSDKIVKFEVKLEYSKKRSRKREREKKKVESKNFTFYDVWHCLLGEFSFSIFSNSLWGPSFVSLNSAWKKLHPLFFSSSFIAILPSWQTESFRMILMSWYYLVSLWLSVSQKAPKHPISHLNALCRLHHATWRRAWSKTEGAFLDKTWVFPSLVRVKIKIQDASIGEYTQLLETLKFLIIKYWENFNLGFPR